MGIAHLPGDCHTARENLAGFVGSVLPGENLTPLEIGGDVIGMLVVDICEPFESFIGIACRNEFQRQRILQEDIVRVCL